VRVKYSRETVTKTEGQFVSLKCEVQYDIQNCDIVSNWWYINGNELKPITDPNHYLITVNETGKNQLRSRNLFLSFYSLSLKDSGQYQCDAKCLNSGTEGKGHLLYLDVKGLNWNITLIVTMFLCVTFINMKNLFPQLIQTKVWRSQHGVAS